MIAVLFAEGFEEVEALAPVDILRRAGLSVVMAGVTGMEVTGSHGIVVKMERKAEEIDPEELEALVLPGGGKGTRNLEASPVVQGLIDQCAERGVLIGAICAAPSILAHKGLLDGREAISFPDFQSALTDGGAELSESYVCQDGAFITARGMGVATQFGLKLVEALISREKAEQIRAAIQWED